VGGYFTNNKVVIPSILLILVLVIGTSFAIWQITLKQADTNQITSSCFKVEFSDKNPITLENAYPMTDEEGKVLTPYEFTISNTCTTNAMYQVNLEVLNDTTLMNNDYIKLMLNEDTPNILTSNSEVEKTIESATKSYKLKKGSLEANTSVTYNLRLWMGDNTPASVDTMNKLFRSKVTVISSYVKSIDKTPPVANVTTTITETGVIVDASSSTDDDSGIVNYYYSLDGKTWIKSSDDVHTFTEEETEIKYGSAVDTIKGLALTKVTEVYVKVEDKFDNMSSVVKKGVRITDLAYDNTVDNNLRYIGRDPSNYVSFNNELWRIIGVMNNTDDGTGNKTSRIKLIRSAPSHYRVRFGSDSLNINQSNWAYAELKNTLNNNYLNSMQEESKLMIDNNVLWSLGAGNRVNDYEHYSYTSLNFYNVERGKYFEPWQGSIGLPYPSDLGFATSGGSVEGRNTCLSYQIHDMSYRNNCVSSNWIISMTYYGKTYKIWTMTPGVKRQSWYYAYDYPYNQLGCGPTTDVTDGARSDYVFNAAIPTLYLKSDIKIISGTGASTDPYILSM